MGATTTRLANRYPLLSDTADVPRDIQNLATDLDKAAIFGVGTLASRPPSASGTPGISGRFYYANDAGAGAGDLYFDFGTGYRKTALFETDGSLKALGGFTVTQINVAQPTASIHYDIVVTPTNYVSGSRVLSYSILGDAQPKFLIDQDGTLRWGPGGAGAIDNAIGRYSAAIMSIDKALWAGWGSGAGASCFAAVQPGDGWPRVGINNNSSIQFGPGTSGIDINMYRYTAGQLALSASQGLVLTDIGSTGYTVFGAKRSADNYYRFRIQDAGTGGEPGARLEWGTGSGNPDTFLYRSAAARLQTDSYVTINRTTATDSALAIVLNNSANATWYMRADGYMMW